MAASRVPSWLYVPGIANPVGTFDLPEDEAHYVSRVCRAHPGDHVTATDGAGAVAELELTRIARVVEARVIARRHEPRTHEAHVLCGAPEGARADWLVEKLAELGIARLQPLECVRANWRGARLDRAHKLAVAALRQSRNAWLLEVGAPISIWDAVRALPEGAARWIADAHAERGSSFGPASALTVAAIGPAPGFDPDERAALLEAGFTPIRLALARLRTETAAIVWAAQWAAAVHGNAPLTPP